MKDSPKSNEYGFTTKSDKDYIMQEVKRKKF